LALAFAVLEIATLLLSFFSSPWRNTVHTRPRILNKLREIRAGDRKMNSDDRGHELENDPFGIMNPEKLI